MSFSRKLSTAGLLLLAGCGDSVATLDRLAATGSIHEGGAATTHLQIRIAAPAAKVWALLIDARSWPKWQKEIDSVTAPARLGSDARFTWRTGGINIHSQVQLLEPGHRLSWTGTALTAKAIHAWELRPEPGDQTLVVMKESMDGFLVAQMFSSKQLAEAGNEWLMALKRAAEHTPRQ